jgi:hypothetical protein
MVMLALAALVDQLVIVRMPMASQLIGVHVFPIRLMWLTKVQTDKQVRAALVPDTHSLAQAEIWAEVEVAVPGVEIRTAAAQAAVHCMEATAFIVGVVMVEAARILVQVVVVVALAAMLEKPPPKVIAMALGHTQTLPMADPD